MSSLTNVNNNSSVVVVGRTAPVPPGQQPANKSLPVVVATDQPPVPVEEQSKIASEVALSLLGIPRSEVALGIFADVNTYDVNPSEWSATPEQRQTFSAGDDPAYDGFNGPQDHGLSHIPEESGALIEAPADKTAVLTSKRFFRYQPGRVSSATFGVKSSITPAGATVRFVRNPAIRKYGIYDNFDGYYWETRGPGDGDHFSVVRRTQSLIEENPQAYGNGQTDDFGFAGNADAGIPGDLVILRDQLIMTHAAIYDPSLLLDETLHEFNDILSNTITLDDASELNVGQHVIYQTEDSAISGLTNTRIYKILSKSGNDVTLSEIDNDTEIDLGALSGTHFLKTPVPFIFPDTSNNTGLEDVMFPYTRDFLNDAEFTDAPLFGAINTAEAENYTHPGTFDGDGDSNATIIQQIKEVNSGVKAADLDGATHDVSGWENWIKYNVKPEFYKVYEFRVPRSRFSGDFVDGSGEREVLFSDVVRTAAGDDTTQFPGQNVKTEADPNANLIRDSIWDIDFNKVLMKKIEFSWYGAVGALFLAYVPVSNGEARWVRVHHLRASNQLKVSSLGNATLPITYTIYGGGSTERFGYDNTERIPNTIPGSGSFSEYISKYGSSYYIDGGDRGTVRLFSHSSQTASEVLGGKYRIQVDASNSQASDPFLVVDDSAPFDINPEVSDFYMLASVLSGDPVDSGVRVIWVDSVNKRLYLSKALSSITGTSVQMDVLVDRPEIVFGVETKQNIISSQGFSVRNRVQVYPTRLSTGVTGTGTSSLKLAKNPIFQNYEIDNWTGDLKLDEDAQLQPAGFPTTLTTSTTPTGLSVGDQIFGWFRGYFDNDPNQTLFQVFGFVRVTSTGFTFTSLDTFNETVILESDFPFLPALNYDSDGQVLDASTDTSEFEIERLSSILVNPELRTPIPGTGSQITNFFLGTGGQQFDLSPYFDFNKDYLSFPLTDQVDSLFLTVSSVDNHYEIDDGAPTGDPIVHSSVLASLTWEEQ